MRKLVLPLIRLHANNPKKPCIKAVLFSVTAHDGDDVNASTGLQVQHVHASSSAADLASAVSQRAIHVLIDLNSHTRGGRLDAIAHRPAPVSATALGYAGSSGAGFVDYLPGDRVMIPPLLRRHYSERLVQLPHSAHAAQHALDGVATSAILPAVANTARERALFGSWNSERKVGSGDWLLWANMLRAYPAAQMQQAMAWPESDAAARLRNELRAAGIDVRRRLVLPTRVSQSEHYARVRNSDLCLDVPHWNGASSSLDVLWGGCPLVALPLATMASRVSASMLSAVALQSVGSVREYERLAVHLLAASR